jgi:hypothetical protein
VAKSGQHCRLQNKFRLFFMFFRSLETLETLETVLERLHSKNEILQKTNWQKNWQIFFLHLK